MPRVLAELWLYGQLSAVPGLAGRVANGRWTGDEAAPWAVFQMVAEVARGAIGQPATVAELRYQAEAVCPGESTLPIEAIAAAMDAAIDGAAEELPGGVTLTCQRIGGIPRTHSYDGDRVWSHMGSEWTIAVLGIG